MDDLIHIHRKRSDSIKTIFALLVPILVFTFLVNIYLANRKAVVMGVKTESILDRK